MPIEPDGAMYIYPFGAVATRDIQASRREAELNKLRLAVPKLTTKVVREDYTVLEDAAFAIGIDEGMLRVDRLTEARAGIVALTVAQSAAMEYYENVVEALFSRISTSVEVMERRGTVPFRTRPLHRIIGEAITARSEVLSVLHLLDRPDEVWEDAAMDRIYNDLRAEFDLADRYAALELLVEVARDRRLFTLEVAVVFLILLELIFTVLPSLR